MFVKVHIKIKKRLKQQHPEVRNKGAGKASLIPNFGSYVLKKKKKKKMDEGLGVSRLNCSK